MLSFAKSRLAGINLFLLIALFLFAVNPVLSQVTIHVPGDQPTIQAGINAAENGDTVLVAEGTYYENIMIQSKAVTLASRFLIDDSTSHISKTIIDGSQPVNTDNASVVTFLNSPNTNVLCGFTITGGYGTKKVFSNIIARGGGGVIILGSSAIIKNNHIIYNVINNITVPDFYHNVQGGGILFDPTGVSGLTLNISKNLIAGNEIQSLQTGGGGLSISFPYEDIVLDYIIEENNIKNNTVINTDTWKAMGGGIFLDFCLPTIGNQTIRNNIIRNNNVLCPHSFGGGLYFIIRDTDSTGTVDNDPGPYVYNNIIYGNHSDYLGGGVSVWRAYYIPGQQNQPLQSAGNYVPKPSFINNTIVNNTAQDGSGFIIMNHKPFLMNNILWNVYPVSAEWGEIFLGDVPYYMEPNHYCGAEMFYNDVQGGWDPDSGEGNIDFDPMFADTLFNLSNSSYCVGNGIVSVDINGLTYNCPSTDFYDDVRSNPIDLYVDIGAIESPYPRNIVGVKDNSIELPVNYSLQQNYPNPFNPTTTIKYSIPKLSFVTIKIYDVLGSEVAALVNEEKAVGTYELSWNAANLPSGVYFYRLQSGNFMQTRKMILLR